MESTSFNNQEAPDLIIFDTKLFKCYILYLQLYYIRQKVSFATRRVGCPVTMVASSLEGWSREVTRGGELLLGHVTQTGWLDVFWQAVRGSISKATNLWQRQALWWSVSSKPLLADFVVSIERDLDKFGYLTSSEVSRLASFGRQSHSVGENLRAASVATSQARQLPKKGD